MNNLRPLLFFVSLLLIVGLACGGTPTQAPIEQPVQLQPPTSEGPKEIVEKPTATPPPTEEAAPQVEGGEAQAFFTEEFDNPLTSAWTPFLIYDENVSDPDNVTVQAEDGKLVWDFDSKALFYYLFYDAFSYEDVKVEAQADNRGVNNNYVSLICRYDPEVGWYEFNVANNGLYNLYYMEILEGGKIRENRIANGGSLAIKQGKEINEYTAICQGDQLTLYINGEKVTSIKEKKYALREGQVGISVSSLNVLPVLIEMDWFKVSEP